MNSSIARPGYFHYVWVLSVLVLSMGTACDSDPSSNRTSIANQPVEAPLFQLLSPEATGVKFANMLPENKEMNILGYEYYYNGGGVAVGDVNNDGLPDLYLTANLVASRLYLNRGNLRFEEVTQQTGTVSRPGWKTGVSMADVDGNGYLDIYVCRSGKMDPSGRANELFMNNGDGSFTDRAAEMGLADEGYGTQSAFFDYDRDGDLDMFLINHSIKSLVTFNVEEMKRGRDPYTGDKLYRNDGGKFTEVGEQAGIFSSRVGFGLGLVISDLNRDGWPDIFVGNDYTEHDYMYLNQQDGTFRESLKESVGHTANFSMGADVADLNNDTWPDLVVLDMLPEENKGQKLLKGPDGFEKYQLQLEHGFYHQNMRNMLQLSNGLREDGQLTFSEVGQLAGISKTDWSWSPLIADYDNDGFRDIFITNGYVRASTDLDFLTYDYAAEQERARNAGQEADVMRVLKLMNTLKRPNYMYRNTGGVRFEKKSRDWGFDRPSFSNGAAYSDLDKDGDLDLIVNNVGEPAFIYQNNSQGTHYLQLALVGNAPNTGGIGARVELTIGDKTLVQEAFPVRGFQSSVDPVLHIGMGDAATVDELRIFWPDGKMQVMLQVPVDQRISLKQSDATTNAKSSFGKSEPLFVNAAQNRGLRFQHQEDDFIDFKREPLLPHQLGRMGPALAVGDLNGDGLEDAIIGGAAGQASTICLQQSNGSFRQKNLPGGVSEAVAAICFDAEGDGDLDVYVVNGGSEWPVGDTRYQDQLYVNNGKGAFTISTGALPSMPTSGGCVAAGDMDGDGDEDLFVGGRVLPAAYPYAPKSYLLRNEGGRFVDITAEVAPDLQEVGMVTDAAWVNLLGDSAPELLMVGEWMPISLFQNQDGKLSLTSIPAFAQSAGWWNRILVHDFDQDGDPDFVLGNHGLNGQMRPRPDQPVSIYAKDFDENGNIDPITCYFIQGKSYPMHSRDELLGQLNFLKKKFIRYGDYADATITDIFSPEQLAGALQLNAYTFSSSYVQNQGDGTFLLKSLPLAAQVSPVSGLIAGDFTGDGHSDILVSGNFYPARVEMGRYDASVGVLLAGNGKGDFHSLPHTETGFFVPGDVRNMKLVKVAGDKEAVLVVRNNEAAGFVEVQ